jgi:hypothetical protein
MQSARLSLQSSILAPPAMPPHPLASESVAPLSLVPRGRTHSLAGEGAVGANSEEETDTLVH